MPRLIADAGENASLRFLDFFTANIRNPNTRAAYAVAVRAFFAWLDAKHVAPLAAVRTHHVSAYVEVLGRRYRAPTVKQHLAAIRMLFDWLIVGQIFAGPNPAAAVRGPKHVVKKGKTSVLDGDEAKKLLDSIDVSTLVGLRDRALIALLVYTFARVSAALHMNVEDYYPQGKRWWVRLHEKGGKQHEMPAHHLLEHFLDAYLTALRHAEGGELDKASPLFRTLGGRGRKALTSTRMARQDARRMIVRRALAAGIATNSAVTRSARRGSPSICSTADCSNTRSRWRRTRARAPPSSTIAATTRSLSIRSSGLFSNSCEDTHSKTRSSATF